MRLEIRSKSNFLTTAFSAFPFSASAVSDGISFGNGFAFSAPATGRHRYKANKAVSLGFIAVNIPPPRTGASAGERRFGTEADWPGQFQITQGLSSALQGRNLRT